MKIAFRLFFVVLTDVWTNADAALRLCIAPTLVLMALVMFTSQTSFEFGGAASLYLFFVGGAIAIVSACIIGVGWSRLMLLDEHPTSWLVTWHRGVMWKFGWRLVVIVLICLAFAGVITVIGTSVLGYAVALGSLKLFGVQLFGYGWIKGLSAVTMFFTVFMFVAVFLRIAARLPGVAAADGLTNGVSSLRRTRPIALPILALAAVCAFIHRVLFSLPDLGVRAFGDFGETGLIVILCIFVICTQLVAFLLIAVLVRIYLHTQIAVPNAEIKDVFG